MHACTMLAPRRRRRPGHLAHFGGRPFASPAAPFSPDCDSWVTALGGKPCQQMWPRPALAAQPLLETLALLNKQARRP